MIKIPINKPLISNKTIQEVKWVLHTGFLTAGDKVNDFERQFAEYCSRREAIAVSSGTSALIAAFSNLHLEKGDEVITTPFSFVATVNALLYCDLKVVFADIDINSFNIDPGEIEKKITSRTKAILTVDLFGNPCNYLDLKRISRKYNLKLIVDASQAAGAEYNNRPIGVVGDIAIFSLYATKNIQCGEGGIILLNNRGVAIEIRKFINQGLRVGSDRKNYEYEDFGINFRLTDFQAVIANNELKQLNKSVNIRRQNAAYYNSKFKHMNWINTPIETVKAKHSYNVYTIRVMKNPFVSRDLLVKRLRARGIDARIYYPLPLHLNSYLKQWRYSFKIGDFPKSEQAAKEVVSLPVHPAMKKNHLNVVVKNVLSIN